jgi:peptidoglycan hydrolase-like protein with peptidoglycan-binding domain
MNEKLGFGAIIRKPKKSDYLIGAFAATPPATRPDVFMPPYTGTIEMQGQQPACGSHSGQAVEQILSSFRGSPEFLWKEIKQIDGLPAEDGTTMDMIFKCLNKGGICSFDLMPNNVNVSIADYASAVGMTSQMATDALTHTTGTYAFTFNPTWEQLKQAIYDHKAVIMMLRVGCEWWTDKNGNNSWQEKDILPLRTNEPVSSGHFVTAYAYDQNYIYFENHWSAFWGRNGIGYFGQDYMPRCVEIGVITQTAPVPFVFSKDMKFGDKNPDVRQLQIKLGMATIWQTSYFGPLTLIAVKSYQITHNLIPDGVVGPLTRNSLNS